jgi:hypothetical protein
MIAAIDPTIDALRHDLFRTIATTFIIASVLIVVGGVALHVWTKRIEKFLARKLREHRAKKR